MISIVGGIKGRRTCKRCDEELNAFETALYAPSASLVTIFPRLGLVIHEEKHGFLKETMEYVYLTCVAKLSYQVNDSGNLVNVKIDCNDDPKLGGQK